VSTRWWTDQTPVDRPGCASPEVVAFATRVLHPLARFFHRATLEGTENLPATGPFLLVANHSGGIAMAEVPVFVALYARRFGGSRPLAGFVHPLSFKVWPLSRFFPMVGAIPSTAESTLAAGVPILVFPGGDHETMRPLWQAYRVDFGGRVGFLRIARKAGIAIVPMGIRGSHFTAPPLVRSRALSFLAVWPRLVGVKRWALSALGVLGAALIVAYVPLAWPWRLLLAWAWIASPFSMLPWIPWPIRVRIGKPIAPESLFDRGGDVDSLARALRIVEDAVEDLVRR
jgi:1-acyl-sn-glycerol-3-phosphate acyltransferase